MSDRPSPIAGSWYPGEATVLAGEIARFLDHATCDRPPGTIMGIVVPHAGYRYSGQTAAYAFRLIQEMAPELVVLLSPLHRSHHARLLTTAYDAYRTPLGRVVVDAETVARIDRLLRRDLGTGFFPLEQDAEHSLEIELPFLQYIWGDYLLVPIMLHDQSAPTARALGSVLSEVLSGRSALIVASSDLSHFHHQSRAVELDGELLRLLASFDPQGILDAERTGAAYACGRGAIAAALWATRAMGADHVTVLHHATSGDVTGDLSSVVGYGAAVIWREERGARGESYRPGHRSRPRLS